jgi:predicted DNA-binding transcriptional regulator AlpA
VIYGVQARKTPSSVGGLFLLPRDAPTTQEEFVMAAMSKSRKPRTKSPKPREKRIKHIVVANPSLSIQEFCDAEGIGRNTYYKLKKQGRAPREFRIGASVRISHEARIAWRRKMQKESEAA